MITFKQIKSIHPGAEKTKTGFDLDGKKYEFRDTGIYDAEKDIFVTPDSIQEFSVYHYHQLYKCGVLKESDRVSVLSGIGEVVDGILYTISDGKPLTKKQAGQLIFEQAKKLIEDAGYSMSVGNFPPDYPISHRNLYHIRNGQINERLINRLPFKVKISYVVEFE